MSSGIMRKSYTIVVARNTGQQMELETVENYMTALNAAKEALTSKHTAEVRIVENNYDDATRRDKKQVIKILTRESNDGIQRDRVTGMTRVGINHETANRASKGIAYIALAIAVLVILGGIVVPLINR